VLIFYFIFFSFFFFPFFSFCFQRRDAMKIQDHVTGAFGDKLSDDSDDELGDGQKGLVMG